MRRKVRKRKRARVGRQTADIIRQKCRGEGAGEEIHQEAHTPMGMIRCTSMKEAFQKGKKKRKGRAEKKADVREMARMLVKYAEDESVKREVLIDEEI